MANFQAHFTAATMTSSLAASTAISLNLVNQSEVIALWFIGLIGGMLPDIDSDDSTSLRVVFKLFGIGVALFCALWFYRDLSVVGLWLICAVVYSLIRYALLPVFERLTVHRGSIHSLLSCTMFALAAVCLSRWCGSDIVFAWCSGCFVLLGMLTHLSLDEIYSVDLADMAFKRSFGTALKPLSIEYPLATALQVLICCTLVYLLPPLQPFVDTLTQAKFSFWPVQEWPVLLGWFGL